MISEEDLACYRINYDPAPYEEAVRRGGDQLVVPIGAAWAIRALCDEVERLNARIKELESRLWDEQLDDAISQTMRIENA